MSYLLKYPLKIAKKLHAVIKPEESNFGRNWKIFPNKPYASSLIYNELISDKPSMIARLGSTELTCIVNYLGVKNKNNKSYKDFIKNKSAPWWWEQGIINQMQNWSGFFPAERNSIEEFCEMMLLQMPQVDILGSWLKEETFFKNELRSAKKVMLEDLEPFFTPDPWTKALEGKKVLVVHPFSETILNQFQFRENLFDNNLLPNFDLKVIQAVQSIAKEETKFKNWFDALESMKKQISEEDFDICILGCGAYGFPLAAFVKELGKKAIHLGGVTQLLFGIKGSRWENYLVYPYENLFNEYWVRPGTTVRPKNADIVEGACYW